MGERIIEQNMIFDTREPREWTEEGLVQAFMEAGEESEEAARYSAIKMMREYENKEDKPEWGPDRARGSFRAQLNAYETIRRNT